MRGHCVYNFATQWAILYYISLVPVLRPPPPYQKALMVDSERNVMFQADRHVPSLPWQEVRRLRQLHDTDRATARQQTRRMRELQSGAAAQGQEQRQEAPRQGCSAISLKYLIWVVSNLRQSPGVAIYSLVPGNTVRTVPRVLRCPLLVLDSRSI